MIIPSEERARLLTLGEGDCTRIELDCASAIAIRFDGQTRCYLNRCPHQGTELDWLPGVFLDQSGRYLQCATHGALFEPGSGLCVSGPCRGESLASISLAEA